MANTNVTFLVDIGFSCVSKLHGSYFSVETVTFQIRAHLNHISKEPWFQTKTLGSEVSFFIHLSVVSSKKTTVLCYV